MYGGLHDQHYKNMPQNTDYSNRITVAIMHVNKIVYKNVIL